jgi:hypothetical protein
MRRSWLAWGAALAFAAGCGRATAPPIAACSEILAQRVPTARVVDHVAEAEFDAVLDYEIGSWWRRWEPPVPGRLACSFEEGPRGELRLRAATLDGVALTSAEITVINADLLLASMRRAGRAAAGP